jgi:hypothetical protein
MAWGSEHVVCRGKVFNEWSFEMRNRFQLPSVVVLTIVSLTGTVASAGTYVFDLPVPQQSLALGDPALTVPFSTSTTFESIESITVELFGVGEEGLKRLNTSEGSTDDSFAPPLSVRLSRIGTSPIGNWAELSTGHPSSIWHSDFGSFGGLRRIDVMPEVFDDFLDGNAEITFDSSNPFIAIGFDTIDILTPSVIHLESARVTIVGQAVPEPGSVVLVASVLLVTGCSVSGRGRLLVE